MTLGSSSRTRTEVDEKALAEAQAKIDEGLGEVQQTAGEEVEGARNRASQRMVEQTAAEAQAEAVESETQPEIDEARALRDATIADLQQRIAEAKDEVDPDRWMSRRSGGQKVAIIAAAMLGGFTEGFTWGRVRDKTLAFIDKQIDRDVATQEAEIRAGRAKRGELRGLVGVLNGKLGDLEQAKKAAKASIYEDLARRFDMIGQNAKEMSIAKKAQATAGHLKIKAGELQRSLVVSLGEKITSGGREVPVQATGGAPSAQTAKMDDKIQVELQMVRGSAEDALTSRKHGGVVAKGASYLPWTKSATIDGDLKLNVIKRVKAAGEQGRLSDQDIKRGEKATYKILMTDEARLYRFTSDYARSAARINDDIRAAVKNGDKASEAKWRDALRQNTAIYRRTIEQLK
jgi:hypothetical protein